MKKSSLKIIIIQLTTIILFLLSNFVSDIFGIKEYLLDLILLIVIMSSIFLLGYPKNIYPKMKEACIAMTVFTLLYQAIIFVGFGIKLGFSKLPYTYGLTYLIKILLPVFLMVFEIEILRHIFLEKGRYNKLIIVISILFFTFVDSYYNIAFYNLGTNKGIFEFILFVFFVSVMKNIMLTYVSYFYGYIPTIIYRIVITILIYVLPIYPTINEYLTSSLEIILCFLIMLFYISMVSFYKKNKDKEEKYKHNNKLIKIIGNIVFVTVLLIFLALMSGLFKYYFLVVGSGSMEPNISMGDIVFVIKTNDYEKLNEGDVLVFKKDNKTVIHRIINKKINDNKFEFITKGDNNAKEDNWIVYEDEVIGLTRYRIKYLGWPTIWIRDLIGG